MIQQHERERKKGRGHGSKLQTATYTFGAARVMMRDVTFGLKSEDKWKARDKLNGRDAMLIVIG